MIDQSIYEILLPIKQKTLNKIKSNLKEDPKKLNIIKASVPLLNVCAFFATSLGESYEYLKDDILYIGGEKFWEKIGIDYDNLYDTIIKVIQNTHDEVERTIIPTL